MNDDKNKNSNNSNNSNNNNILQHKLFHIDSVYPWDKNPRDITENAIEKLKNLIQYYGYINPIIIDQNNIIRSGHTRYYALKRLEYDHIDCIQIHFESENDAVGFAIAENKSYEFTSWNDKFLSQNVIDLINNEFDFTKLGFSDNDIKTVVEAMQSFDDIVGIEENFGSNDDLNDSLNDGDLNGDFDNLTDEQKQILSGEKDYNYTHIYDTTELKQKLKDKNIIIAINGSIDSIAMYYFIKQYIAKQKNLYVCFVNTGYQLPCLIQSIMFFVFYEKLFDKTYFINPLNDLFFECYKNKKLPTKHDIDFSIYETIKFFYGNEFDFICLGKNFDLNECINDKQIYTLQNIESDIKDKIINDLKEYIPKLYYVNNKVKGYTMPLDIVNYYFDYSKSYKHYQSMDEKYNEIIIILQNLVNNFDRTDFDLCSADFKQFFIGDYQNDL